MFIGSSSVPYHHGGSFDGRQHIEDRPCDPRDSPLLSRRRGECPHVKSHTHCIRPKGLSGYLTRNNLPRRSYRSNNRRCRGFVQCCCTSTLVLHTLSPSYECNSGTEGNSEASAYCGQQTRARQLRARLSRVRLQEEFSSFRSPHYICVLLSMRIDQYAIS